MRPHVLIIIKKKWPLKNAPKFGGVNLIFDDYFSEMVIISLVLSIC